jgi:hypothetical protein
MNVEQLTYVQPASPLQVLLLLQKNWLQDLLLQQHHAHLLQLLPHLTLMLQECLLLHPLAGRTAQARA